MALSMVEEVRLLIGDLANRPNRDFTEAEWEYIFGRATLKVDETTWQIHLLDAARFALAILHSHRPIENYADRLGVLGSWRRQDPGAFVRTVTRPPSELIYTDPRPKKVLALLGEDFQAQGRYVSDLDSVTNLPDYQWATMLSVQYTTTYPDEVLEVRAGTLAHWQAHNVHLFRVTRNGDDLIDAVSVTIATPGDVAWNDAHSFSWFDSPPTLGQHTYSLDVTWWLRAPANSHVSAGTYLLAEEFRGTVR